MTLVTSLLTALERHDSAALTDVLDHDGMTDEHLTCDEAALLWDAGWHAWLGGGRQGQASGQAGDEGEAWRHEPGAADHDACDVAHRRDQPQLWPITLGLFLRVLHATFPALPGAPPWAVLQDVEEE